MSESRFLANFVAGDVLRCYPIRSSIYLPLLISPYMIGTLAMMVVHLQTDFRRLILLPQPRGPNLSGLFCASALSYS